MKTKLSSALFSILSILLLPAGLVAQAQGDWPYAGHDPGAQRFSPLKQINPRNVKKLRRAWTFRTGDPAGNVNSEGAPLVVGGVLYLVAGKNVFALEPETGRQIWKYETKGTHARGASYWPGDSRTSPRIVLGVAGNQMLALDAKTGKPAEGFGEGGFVSGASPNAAPAIYRDLIITGENRVQMVRAWDAHTGKLVWTFYTKAQPGQPGYDTWLGKSWDVKSGTDVWSFITLDAERGLVFFPVAPSGGTEYYGGLRLGNALYNDSLVALDAATGKLVWYQQLVHHDLWDYDVPAPPTLFDVKRNGKTIPAVAEFSKQGLLFLFDRTNGTPLFGMEERPVPQSDVPGEVTSPTQPFPLKPPPLAPMSLSKADIYNLTPEHAAFCKDLWEKYNFFNNGPFTPYSADPNRMTVISPGREGSGNWGGVAYDPRQQYIFGTTVFNTAQVGRLVKREKELPSGGFYDKEYPGGGSRYNARFWDPKTGWPCINPPWAELFAVNAKTGDIAWRVPFGTVDALAEKGFPHTGAPNTGSMIVTAGGLIFIGATNDGRFRAFDSRTGRELWTEKIDASAHTIPVTYMGKNGKQYVVVEAFGGPGIVAITGFFNDAPGDSVIAFALP
ncbi:MAG: pyrroloquinoline quinone-dependent dehydrogenase [Acidobacteriia bacterium]|nr:pyrroloquinoline quinone-dependent dehydrogenase [Terriglobia bacterium]